MSDKRLKSHGKPAELDMLHRVLMTERDDARAELAAARALVSRFVECSNARQAHIARGYVGHEEHQATVLALVFQGEAIVADAILAVPPTGEQTGGA